MCLLLREAMNVGRVAISDYFFSVELQQLEAKKRIKDELLNVSLVFTPVTSTHTFALGSIAW